MLRTKMHRFILLWTIFSIFSMEVNDCFHFTSRNLKNLFPSLALIMVQISFGNKINDSSKIITVITISSLQRNLI